MPVFSLAGAPFSVSQDATRAVNLLYCRSNGFLLVPKTGSCEHIENDLPTHGSIILKKRMEIEHALFSSDTLLER